MDKRARGGAARGPAPPILVSSASLQYPPRAAPDEAVTYGPVYLDVVDRDQSLAWWRDLVGLQTIDEDDESMRLGAGDDILVVLRPGATSGVRRPKRSNRLSSQDRPVVRDPAGNLIALTA